MLLVRMIPPATALLLALLTSAALIVGAHLFEIIGHMAPCILCLDQREAHWAAMVLASGALVVGKISGSERAVAGGLGALALIYFFSAGLAGYHTGVEWGWWEGPAGCASDTNAAVNALPGSREELLAQLSAPGPAGPPCEEAAWRLFGISMAGYNTLFSLGLALIAALGFRTAIRRWKRDQAAMA